MAGGNLPFGLAPSGSLTSYTPTLRERATDWVRRTLFSDDREGQGRAAKVMDVASVTPFGFGLDVYDAGREAGLGNYGTAGLMLGMAGAPGPGPRGKPFGFTAYHGSPHDFDQFSLDKIGTGEGAQAYGHGLYFAENEGVAKLYRDALAPAPNAAQEAAQRALKEFGGDTDAAANHVAKFIEENGAGMFPDTVEHYRSVETMLRNGSASPGRMYEVEINADPDAFLDWDKPLSEQGAIDRFSSLPEFARPLDEVEAENVTGQRLHQRLANKLGEDGASTALREAGIPGIKYLDAGSRGAGDGTRNYVIFRDDIIQILRKYGVTSVAALPAAAQLALQEEYGVDPAKASDVGL